MTGIYCIENKENGKKYVGHAKNIQSRWRIHKSQLRRGAHINRFLQRAWNKYGEDAFAFYVLEECREEDLREAEMDWIEKLGTFKDGYNLTIGGEGQLGKKLTKEQKEYLSAINLGERNPNYGLKRSAETRRRMSEAMKGKKHGEMSLSHREAISRGNKGKKKPWFNKPIVCVETGEVFESISIAADKTGISISGISCVCRGKRKTVYKKHFKFLEE